MRTNIRQLRAMKQSMGHSLGLDVNVQDWSYDKLAEARRHRNERREAGVFPTMLSESEWSLNEKQALRIQQNQATMEQQGLVEAAAALRDIGRAAEPPPAPPPSCKRLKTDFRRDDRIYVWRLVDNQWIKRFGSITTCDPIDNEYDVTFDSVGEVEGEEVRTHGSSIFHVEAASEPPQPRTVVKQEAF